MSMTDYRELAAAYRDEFPVNASDDHTVDPELPVYDGEATAVGMGHSETAATGMLGTRGLASCIGIVLSDDEHSMLYHAASGDGRYDRDPIEAFCAASENEISATYVWGNRPDAHVMDQVRTRVSETATSGLSEQGLWAGGDGSVAVDAGTGELYAWAQDDEEYMF